MRNVTRISVLSLGLLSTAGAYAGTMGEEVSKYHLQMMLSGGPIWTAAGQSQTITLTTQPAIQNHYEAQRNVSTFGGGSIFVAVDRLFENGRDVALGIAFTGAGQAKVKGDVWQDADPDFDNFDYTYNLSQFRIGLKGRVVSTKSLFMKSFDYRIMPYGSGEIAIGWNSSSRYQTTPKIDTAVVQPPFASNTETALSYAFGAGLQGKVNDHVQVAAGYEIAGWGNSSLGLANGQTTKTKLSLNNLYANQLLFSVIYTA